MLNNYYTIKETALYLNKLLSGMTMEDCFTQEKNKLLFEISDPDIQKSFILEFSIEKDYNYLIIKNHYSKSKKNFASLFEKIIQSKILEVRQFSNDRVISILLDNGRELVFTLYSFKANCFLTENKIVIDAFKNKEGLTGENVTELLPSPKHPDSDLSNIKTVSDLLKMRYKKFGNLYAAEVLMKLNLVKDQSADNYIIDKIADEFDLISEKLETPEYLIYKNNSNVHLSLIEAEHLKNYEKIEFSNVNNLITEFLKLKFRTEKTDILKDKNLSVIEKKIADIEKKIKGIEIQLHHCEDSGSLKKAGEIILQNIYLISKGDSEFTARDNIADGKEIRIRLKRDLSPSENAGYYFDKYKKQKNSIDTLKVKLKSFISDKAAAEAELQRVKNMTEYKSLVKAEKKTEDAKNDETSGFRKFTLNEKYEVWVGKDSASNDRLTTKFTAQNDLWFHVRGASGSHTVLKVSNKKEDVCKEFILKAAAIAAYYSKSRNASNVPVAYCEKKYVKKKKGFKQGSVVMEREKVVFVKPSLPDPVA
ncbi:MAG TPA: NFACT RNA binding domain-containing protein [Ignavibacteria bacterium]|nr:NFACT RNA binding domain-containing protein [Ignavibacteria bacterium]HMR40012.1 NFACT RNA binding domain-containing protein [Ignavibacteria bacterium]